jgi:hypothetical protein
MLRILALFLLLFSTLFGNVIDFFQAHQTKKIVCKVYFNGYMLLGREDASVTKIGEDTYFKLKGKNFYIPSTACKVIRKESAPLFF